MSTHPALALHLFAGQTIGISTDQRGETWFVASDVCNGLRQRPVARALTNLRQEEQALHSEEGPGTGDLTVALISKAGLLRLLLVGDSPTARRMRRWLTHELLPALRRRHQGRGVLPQSSIEAIRRQTAAEVLRGAEEIIHLTGVSHAEALLSVLEEIQAHSSPADTEVKQRCSHRAGVAWLTADQLAERLERTLRSTNQGLAAAGLQQRNEEDDWQLTEAGRDWGIPLPANDPDVVQRQRILWHPTVVSLLRQEV